MVNRQEAEKAVLEHLERQYPRLRGEIVIIGEETITKPYGWVFFFNSRRFVESGDLMYAFGGNGPIIVEASSGKIYELSPACPVEESILRFEREHHFD